MNSIAHQRAPHSPRGTGITELILAKHDNSISMVLPMLAHLSHQSDKRWLTWISPTKISKPLLEAYGFSLGRVRLVHTASDQESKRALQKALANGNSETVVAELNAIGEQERRGLETACTIGESQGLILRARP